LTRFNGSATLDVSFTDLSTQQPTSWSWDFGDGGSSSDQNPAHEYIASGIFTVSLTVTNASGSHTRVLPNLISVTGDSTIFLDGFEEP
jgi:PKD repeat protein